MPDPLQQQSAALCRPADWVDRHGDVLFRYALRRVGDREIAEELVQECFLAALKTQARFEGNSTERSWLVGILKHKIMDHFRREVREQPAPADAENVERIAFNSKGFWNIRVSRWKQDPQALVENQEFWAVLRRCLERLPRGLAAAFALREIDDRSSDEVCQVLGLTETNLWARLHRARLGLRLCLDRHWFSRGGSDERPSREQGG